VRGHDDEIESILSRDSSDLGRGVSPSQNSGTLRDRELSSQEGIESLPADAQMLFQNVGNGPYLKLQAVVAAWTGDMNK
jgi:hypothetical protein